MNELDLHAHRIERLVAAIDRVSRGDKTDFGRKLGYKDGAFVRQMAAGGRPITEKTVAKIEALHGMAGWFAAHDLSANGPAKAIRNYEKWPLRKIDEEKVRSLNETDLLRLEDAILIAAGHVGLDIKKP